MKTWLYRAEPPTCFEKTQWEGWKRLAKLSEFKGSPCIDCTPAFQADMKNRALCENPFVVFDGKGDAADVEPRLPKQGKK